MKRKQWLAMMLTAAMVLSTTPISVFAADEAGTVVEAETVTEQREDTEGNKSASSSEEETAAETKEKAETIVEESVQEAEVTEEEGTDASYASSGTCGENLSWTLDANGTLTISGTGKMTNYRTSVSGQALPTGYAPWIGDLTVSRTNNINTIIIEDGVTSIGNYAFYNCYNLKTISIPKSVTSIGNYAFKDCSGVGEIPIPNSVTSIGQHAFENCTSLNKDPLPESVTSIGSSAFENCSSLTNVTIPRGVTAILSSTFSGCSSLTNVSIPESVTSIGGYAFSDCSSLEDISIPNSVTEIGSRAFANCSKLKRYPIPDSVKTIESYTFLNCSSLKTITISKSVTAIKEGAFSGCSGIIDVKSLGNATSIEKNTFYGCSSLTNIMIPYSVRDIKSGAFEGCSSLTDVYYAGTEADWNGADGLIWINIVEDGNDALKNARKHYESAEDDIVTSIELEEYEAVCGEEFTLNAVVKLNEVETFSIEDFSFSVGVNLGSTLTHVDTGEITYNQIDEYTYQIPLTFTASKPGIFLLTVYYGDASANCKIIVDPGQVQNVRWKNDACGHQVVVGNNIGAIHRKLDMEWDSLEGVEGYEVRISQSKNFPESDTESLNATSETSYLDTQSQLRERGSTWYFRVAAYITVDGEIYYGPWSDTFEAEICEHAVLDDFLAIKNQTNVTIPDDIRQRFYTPGIADVMGDDGKYGQCFGLSMVGLACIYGSDGFLNTLGVSKLSEIKSYDDNELAQEMVYSAQTLTGSISFYGDINNLGDIYSRISSYTSYGGLPVLLSLHHGKYGHSIIALDIIEETDEKAVVRVYDCNYKNEERTMTFNFSYDENTHLKDITSWEYYDEGQNLGLTKSLKNNNGATSGDYIRAAGDSNVEAFITMLEEYFLKGGDGNTVYQRYVGNNHDWQTFGVNDVKSQNFYNYIIKVMDQENATQAQPTRDTSDDEIEDMYFWLPSADPQTVTLEDVPSGTGLKLANDYHVVSVEMEADSDIEMSLQQEGDVSVSVTPESSAQCQIVIKDADESGDTWKERELNAEVSAGKELVITRDGDFIEITGADSVSVSQDSGKMNSSGFIVYSTETSISAEIESGKQYRYEGKNRSAVIAADEDGDGEYEKTIAEYENPYLFDPTFAGFASYEGGLFFVYNGSVVTEANGLVQDIVNTDDWYFCANGQAQLWYTGLALYDREWFYVENGKLDTKLSAFVEYDSGLFAVAAGMIVRDANGLVQDPQNLTQWYYCAAGQVQNQYTGLAQYDGAWFYIREGKLDSDYTGRVSYDGAEFYVDHGMIQQ